MNELTEKLAQLRELRARHREVTAATDELVRHMLGAADHALHIAGQIAEALDAARDAEARHLAAIPGLVDLTLDTDEEGSNAREGDDIDADTLSGRPTADPADSPRDGHDDPRVMNDPRVVNLIIEPGTIEHLDAHRDTTAEDFLLRLTGLGHVGADGEYVLTEQGQRVLGHDDEDEETPSTPLAVTITGPIAAPDVAAAIEEILPSLVEQFGRYELDPVTVHAHGGMLVAEPNVGIPADTLPAGTRVALAPLPHRGVTIEVVVAGDVDAENPPLDPAAETNRIVEELDAEGAAVPNVEEIKIVLDRLDGQELTVADATTHVVPTAVNALSAMLGAHEVTAVVDGESASQKVARLRPAGDGQLDRRSLAVGIAAFDGVLPFGHLGRIRARAVAS